MAKLKHKFIKYSGAKIKGNSISVNLTIKKNIHYYLWLCRIFIIEFKKAFKDAFMNAFRDANG